MSAQCNRVAVEDGHTESVSVKLKKKAKPEEIIEAWNEFRSRAAGDEAAQRAGTAGACT